MRDSFAKCVPVRATDKHVPRSDEAVRRLNSHGRVRLSEGLSAVRSPLFELVGIVFIDETPRGPHVITLEDVTQ